MRKYLIMLLIIPIALISACTPKNKNANAQDNLVQQQNTSTATLHTTQPAYFPKHSDEISNINERTARYEDPNRVSYISLITLNGGILYTGTVKGKVSSVDSQVTPADGVDCVHYGARDPRPDGCGVVQVAEPDGSWGTNNPNAIFWFDNNNVYHEWDGLYFVSDQPQTLTTPPVLNINAVPQANKLHP